MPIIVNNFQDVVAVNETMEITAEKSASKVMQEEGREYINAEVSITFVDDQHIQDLNQEYRGINRPTDVLSFPMLEFDSDETGRLDEDVVLLGDVIISLETAVRQAKEYNHSLEREIAFLTVHGVLHLLGFDHIDESDRKLMQNKEETILNLLNYKR